MMLLTDDVHVSKNEREEENLSLIVVLRKCFLYIQMSVCHHITT